MSELASEKARRKSLRLSFTVSAKKIEEEIAKEIKDSKNLEINQKQLSDKFYRLEACQDEISKHLLEEDEDVYSKDFLEAEAYRDRYLELSALIEQFQNNMQVSQEAECSNNSRRFQLPVIQLKKFNGEAKNFLAFWSQFKKIDEDTSLPNEDKFMYLLQAMEPNSKAERLVLSFPATAANYPKAIEHLRERFGRDDLLVQIYVRDLLTLVMRNAAQGRAKVDLPSLYDELEGKLRALESLGRTQEKYGDFLTPLVESCLPEDILMAWERSRNHQDLQETDFRSLGKLMSFLRQEVKGEEMVSLARSGFGAHLGAKKKEPPVPHQRESDVPTAAALVNVSPNSNNLSCIFCEKGHFSHKCFAAKKLSFEEKIDILSKKGACFTCLTKGNHLSRFCGMKNKLKCTKCSLNHYDIMCKKGIGKSVDVKPSPSSELTLSNCNRRQTTVYLQVLRGVIKGRGQEMNIRVLLDSASQNSHLSKRVICKLGLVPHRTETVIHSLFGGSETKPKSHGVYSIELGDVKGKFSTCFEVLSEDKICGFVPKLTDPQVLANLREVGIELSDSCSEETEIDLLVGADMYGHLLIGKSVTLDSGLTVLDTKLGKTVIGSINNVKRIDGVFTSLAMHTSSIHLSDLWELENLGILDPIKIDNDKTSSIRHLEDFQEKLVILPDGRYEVELPWKCDIEILPENESLVKSRHEKMVQRARGSGYLQDYQKVFDDWEHLDIIERVPEAELNNKCHYLTHRPVIKMQSQTTKIRRRAKRKESVDRESTNSK